MLVGRVREMDVLSRALESARSGKGSMHLLSGEPGIGKTRLADEIASRAATTGVTVAWGRAWETGGAPPFYPWREILETFGGEALGAPILDASLRERSRGEGASPDPMRERF